jgi:hypothetical protein
MYLALPRMLRETRRGWVSQGFGKKSSGQTETSEAPRQKWGSERGAEAETETSKCVLIPKEGRTLLEWVPH